jgi:hypothetical protein
MGSRPDFPHLWRMGDGCTKASKRQETWEYGTVLGTQEQPTAQCQRNHPSREFVSVKLNHITDAAVTYIIRVGASQQRRLPLKRSACTCLLSLIRPATFACRAPIDDVLGNQHLLDRHLLPRCEPSATYTVNCTNTGSSNCLATASCSIDLLAGLVGARPLRWKQAWREMITGGTSDL